MSLIVPLLLLLVVAVTSLKITRPFRLPYTSTSLPPGPPGSWILGNVKDINAPYLWRKFSSWSKTYGNIIHLNALGRPIIVLNDFNHARVLMEKQSASYSDRPRMIYINKILKIKSMTFMGYGDLWRFHRRIIAQQLNQRSVIAFQSGQTQCVRELIHDLLVAPEEFWKKTHKFAASTILLATYGYQVAEKDDPLVKLNEVVERLLFQPGAPGTTVVDIFPPFAYLPSFLPGASLKRRAERERDSLRMLSDWPYEEALKKREYGLIENSFVSLSLAHYEQKNDVALHSEAIKEICASMYRAGVATTLSVLRVFILAMILHPHVARKAQRELDKVIGKDRLPDFADRKDVNYIDCILKECLRWRPPLPLGIAHTSTRNGDVDGMFIPEKSLILPNIWHMMHDERFYEEPDNFNPDRFESEGASRPRIDPREAVFGFGRRICPGRYFAEGSLWMAMSNILVAFDILPGIGEDGNEIFPLDSFSSGLTSEPLQFKCRFIPRSEKVKQYVLFSI